jgi:hypothetical protein
MIGHFHGAHNTIGHFPLSSGVTPKQYPNSFIQGWNEPVKMDGIIYFDQILGAQ